MLVVHYCNKLGIAETAVIGSSAGAYMALRSFDAITSNGITVTSSIFLSPAAYPIEIENIPYGAAFTRIAREPWDISLSPAFADLEKHAKSGTRFLISFFEVDDPPIPMAIQEYYTNTLRRLVHDGARGSVLIIPGVSHNFHRLVRKKRQNLVDDNSVIATAKKFVEFLKE